MSEENNAPPSETEQAEILSQPTPYHIAAAREETAGGPGGTYRNHTGMETLIPDNYFDGADLPAEKRAAAVVELRHMLADTGLAPAEVSGLFQRSAIVRSEGKSDEQQRKEARGELQRVFGKDGADSALRDAATLIKRDPRFAKWIEKKGIGNDVETIIQMARAARSLRSQGRLK